MKQYSNAKSLYRIVNIEIDVRSCVHHNVDNQFSIKNTHVAGYFTQGRGLAPRPSGSPRLVLNPGATRDALALGRGRSPREVLASASFPASAAMNGYRDALLARPLLVAGLCLSVRFR